MKRQRLNWQEKVRKNVRKIMDFEHVKAVFEEYLNGYDRENDKVKLKIVHTYGVIRCSEEIGRFEQLKRFNSFEADTMDHATYGVQVLFEEGMIRQFIEEDTWDDVIRTAIAKHSDYELTGITDERTLLHARLIRDADKLDNCRVKLEASIEAMLGVSEETAGEGLISPKVWESCLRRESVLSADRHVPVDYWVSYLAQYYDINFPETCEIIEEEDYITRIADRIHYQEQDTSDRIRILTEDLKRYLEMPAVSVKE